MNESVDKIINESMKLAIETKVLNWENYKKRLMDDEDAQ